MPFPFCGGVFMVFLFFLLLFFVFFQHVHNGAQSSHCLMLLQRPRFVGRRCNIGIHGLVFRHNVSGVRLGGHRAHKIDQLVQIDVNEVGIVRDGVSKFFLVQFLVVVFVLSHDHQCVLFHVVHHTGIGCYVRVARVERVFRDGPLVLSQSRQQFLEVDRPVFVVVPKLEEFRCPAIGESAQRLLGLGLFLHVVTSHVEFFLCQSNFRQKFLGQGSIFLQGFLELVVQGPKSDPRNSRHGHD
mmetsp:Transcript_753/g.1587  ORF Transcript_753/g.1587 Transcript_753/m.1587 type:complete len:241 (+) Transcript_753:68-790(+)